jgi:hypothetical protein
VDLPRFSPFFRIGGPWVAFECGPAAKRWQLYNIQSHRWRRLACETDCHYATFVAVSAVWLLVEVTPHQSCGDGIHNECGPTTYVFHHQRDRDHQPDPKHDKPPPHGNRPSE